MVQQMKNPVCVLVAVLAAMLVAAIHTGIKLAQKDEQIIYANRRISDLELRIKEANIAVMYLLQDFRNLKREQHGKDISSND